MLHKTRLVRALVAAFGSSAALGSPALLHAQDNGTPNAQGGTEEVQRVTVTGTNVRRTDAETPSPVQVITADDIKQSGYTTINDVLQNLSANGQGTLSQGFAGAFASGAAGVSLRGLNTSATLVLINGHRSAPYPIGDDGQRSFVDVSNIPFEAVERIEVLKDGASAIYGSDAMAGVINIILRKSYTGAQVGAEAGTSYKGDGSTRQGNLIYGFGDLDKDGHNFYIALEGRSQDQIRDIDRGAQFNKLDFRDQGGINTTLGVPNDANGGLARSATGYIYVRDPNTGVPHQYFLPGCDQASYDAGQCTYKNTWAQIVPNTSNFNAVSRFTFNLTPQWQASVDGSFFQSKAQQLAGPARATSYQGVTNGPGISPSLLDPVVPTLPSSNPAFPASALADGITEANLRYTFLDIGPQITDTDAKTTRLVGELTGSYMDWDVTAALGYTQVKLAVRGYHYVEPALLQEALHSTTDPYVPGQENSQSVIDFIAPKLYADDVSKLEFGHLNLGRDLMPLGGGPLSMAVGIDAYHRTQVALAPVQVEQGQLTGIFSNNYTMGYQNVWSGYAELVAPFAKTFEAELAARYDHYNLSGGKVSPKLGMKWTPSEVFSLRGTAARGFRAPGPAENGTAGQTFFAAVIDDPILCPNGENPTAPGNFPTQCQEGPATLQRTTPNLKPETSTSFTLGTILEPVKDFNASLDFYYVKVSDQIVTDGNPNDQVQVRGTDFSPIPFVNPDGTIVLKVPPVAPIAYLSAGYVNANSTTTDGLDLDLQWKHRFANGLAYKSDLLVTYMLKYDLAFGGTTYHLAGTHGPLVIGGDTGNPRTHLQWAHTLSQGPWEATGTMNYVSGYSLLDPSSGVTDCLGGIGIGAAGTAFFEATTVPPGVSCRVGSFFTFDLAGRYSFDKHWTVNGSIVNLFNKGAPLDWGTYGGGVAIYNPSLHQAGAIGRYLTLGATYKF